MKISKYLAVLTSGVLATGVAQAQSVEAQIAQAMLPLPEEMRADASVFNYDEKTGERVMLREGPGYVECKPRDERGYTLCFPRNTAARRDHSAKLAASGLEGDELRAAMMAAEEAGTVEPTPSGSMLYRLYEKDDRIQLLWVVLLPNATSDELGMSVESQRDNSLAGMGRPWMMREGTPSAHLMIPINGTALSNKGGAPDRMDTRSIKDMVVQGTLPLPKDLRDGATVITYTEAGDRKVLRQGTNMIECQARDASSGFTRCYHKNQGVERDFQARLAAEGKSRQEIGAATSAAREDGTLPAAPFGSIAYRLYEEDDRLRLLWVLRLPNATSEQLGMPTGSQRDNALAGKGLPWMMREGTASAHLMIPINSTELSNKSM